MRIQARFLALMLNIAGNMKLVRVQLKVALHRVAMGGEVSRAVDGDHGNGEYNVMGFALALKMIILG